MLTVAYPAFRRCLLGAAIAAALVPFTVQASDLTFTTINDPADNSLQTPTFNQLLGINDAGVIAGYYGDGVLVNNHGFVYQNGTFTPENVPGTDQTQVVAINNTMSGGSYQTAGFSVINASGLNQGFTKVGPAFTNVNGPGSTFTQLAGLNDHGQAVGFYVLATGAQVGFLYSLNTSTVTPIATPISWNALSVSATGINNAGTIVGFYNNLTGTFAFIDKNGNFMTPTDPLGANPMFFGINNVGQIVGTDTAADGSSEGFIYDWMTGTWTRIIDPNEVTTPDGFAISGTTLNGINDEGQVVGFYAGANGKVDGLLVNTTPEPASVSLVGLAGAIGVLVSIKRRKVQQPG